MGYDFAEVNLTILVFKTIKIHLLQNHGEISKKLYIYNIYIYQDPLSTHQLRVLSKGHQLRVLFILVIVGMNYEVPTLNHQFPCCQCQTPRHATAACAGCMRGVAPAHRHELGGESVAIWYLGPYACFRSLNDNATIGL